MTHWSICVPEVLILIGWNVNKNKRKEVHKNDKTKKSDNYFTPENLFHKITVVIMDDAIHIVTN